MAKIKTDPAPKKASAFSELGLKATVAALCEEIRELYTADDVPWIIGYSGGKDSTATLQLVWMAIAELPVDQRKKPVHVISTDTMVENPVVAAWVANSLCVMKAAANEQAMPIKPHRLTPKISDSYWVNLIGRGYPAPRHKFRWCTERLKIKPSNTFINSIIKDSGEAILILGSRKAESARRSANMEKHEKGRLRDRLSPNASLPGSLVYTPIESWTNDDVWLFLMQVRNTWDYTNDALLAMYAGASEDGECPLVVDTSTQSCGDSRFGCWVCTLVEQDKSMTAMIRNAEEMEWMEPLLFLRNATDFRWLQDQTNKKVVQDYVDKKIQLWEHPACLPLKKVLLERAKKPLREIALDNWEKYLRDFRRMNGSVQMFYDDALHGPYLQATRECWLTLLLNAQNHLQKHAPAGNKMIELITLDELQEIRRIWVVDKHELEDTLPRIYKEATGQPYPGRPLDDNLVLDAEDMTDLQTLCGEDRLHYELTRELLGVVRQQRSNGRRSGIFTQLEKAFRRSYYDSREDALSRAVTIAEARNVLEEAKKDRFMETPENEENEAV